MSDEISISVRGVVSIIYSCSIFFNFYFERSHSL